MEEPEQAASVAPCVPVCVYSGECLSACGRPTQRVRRCCQAGGRCGCVRQERGATVHVLSSLLPLLLLLLWA